MEKYQIIPRKFRPKQFAEVAGHEAIVTTLKNALKFGWVGQAYLFCGGRGCGKTTLARLFAKALNCSQLSEDGEPCNQCQNCQEISEGRSLDLLEIDGASNRGIDDIRQLNQTIAYAPNKGPYKIYLIDEVHMLTKEAFNALLKTLEEPPKNVKFFFATTEPHKIPQTITSRCQRFNLRRISEKRIVQKLKEISEKLRVEIDEEALHQISRLSEGSLRDAQSFLDQLICMGKSPITLELTKEMFGLVSQEFFLKLDGAIHTQDFELAMDLAKEFNESGKDLSAAIDEMLEHFRLHLFTQSGEAKKGYSKHQTLLILDKLIDWQKHLLKTPHKQIYLEMILLDLVRSFRKIPIDSLVERLIELEAKLASSSPTESIQNEIPKKESPVEEIKTKTSSLPKNSIHPSKYDTLIRFAAIELEGSVS